MKVPNNSIHRPKQHVYLTNACGEPTGYSEVSEADLNKVAFEEGPGFVLPYIVIIDGKKYVQGNLEVAFQDDFWGDSDNFLTEAQALAYCERICDEVAPRLYGGHLLLPIDVWMPGRFVVQVAVPLDSVSNSLAVRSALECAFGEYVNLPSVEEGVPQG